MIEISLGELAGLLIVFLPFVILIWSALRKKNREP